MIKLATGYSNWDLYLEPYNSIRSVPKQGNEYQGCQETQFGSIQYFINYLKNNDRDYQLTTQGMKLLELVNTIKNDKAVNLDWLQKHDFTDFYKLLSNNEEQQTLYQLHEIKNTDYAKQIVTEAQTIIPEKPLWQQEFPNYEKHMEGITIPSSFTDTSWNQDISPTFINENLKVILWVNKKEPEERLEGSEFRFNVYPYADPNNDSTDPHKEYGTLLLETNEFKEVENVIEKLESEKVAILFAALLKQELSPDEFKEMNERNAKESEPNICHSHDFLDANLTMKDAIKASKISIFMEEEDGIDWNNDRTLTIINTAWNLALENQFEETKILSEIQTKNLYSQGKTDIEVIKELLINSGCSKNEVTKLIMNHAPDRPTRTDEARTFIKSIIHKAQAEIKKEVNAKDQSR